MAPVEAVPVSSEDVHAVVGRWRAAMDAGQTPSPEGAAGAPTLTEGPSNDTRAALEQAPFPAGEPPTAPDPVETLAEGSGPCPAIDERIDADRREAASLPTFSDGDVFVRWSDPMTGLEGEPRRDFFRFLASLLQPPAALEPPGSIPPDRSGSRT